MKKTLKFLLPGALALAFFAAPSAIIPTVSAQDATAASACNPDERAALDKKFRDNYKTNKDVAYQAGKDYIAKCNDAEGAEFVKYLQNWIAKQDVAKDEIVKQAVRDKCINALKAKNSAEVFSGCQAWTTQPWYGTDSIAAYPVLAPIDHGFVLATSNPPVNTYNDQTIALTKQAIQKIESNSLGDIKWADYQYKSKEDALAWMNYIIGYITFNNLTGKEADAVPYLYKSLQYNSEIKTKPLPYYALGFNYRTQYNKAVQDFQTKYANASEVTDEMKKDIGMQKALADRAIDAFARAYKTAVDSKLPQAAIDARKKDLEQMYKIRNKDQTTDWNTLASSVASKPLPDPNSPLEPVMEELTPTTTTGTTGGSTAMTSAGDSTKAGAETGSRNTTAAAAKTTNGTAATKPAAKPAATKPAPKPKKPSR